LKDASVYNNEVADLLTRVNEHISAAIRYSCRYWISHWLEHFRAADYPTHLPLGLDVFCEQHLLHWIEVLSLVGDMNAVQRVMPELMSIIKVRFSPLQYLFWVMKCLPELHRLEGS
jgi:hypothetical protein